MRARCGFTLVEILIVVVILGVLAAIVAPLYSSVTNDTQTTCLRSNLYAIRKQIELYKIQHNGVLPVAVGETTADFTRRMTTKTDGSGAAGTQFGPYLERVPANAFNDRTTVRVGEAPAGANTDGWRFDFPRLRFAKGRNSGLPGLFEPKPRPIAAFCEVQFLKSL
jgi:general secretion pathway protein G